MKKIAEGKKADEKIADKTKKQTEIKAEGKISRWKK